MALLEVYTGKKLEPFIDPTGLVEVSAKFTASQNIAKGTVLGIVTSTGLCKPYASGNSDGTQKPVYLAIYDMQVDSSGNVTFSDTSGLTGGSFGLNYTSAPVAIAGTFACADLTGLDATAITNNPAWNLVGSLSTGTLRIG